MAQELQRVVHDPMVGGLISILYSPSAEVSMGKALDSELPLAAVTAAVCMYVTCTVNRFGWSIRLI